MKSELIYHIVPEKELLSQVKEDEYIPVSFNEFGFVHCALEVSVIPVANDYFSKTQDRLILLKIDPGKLTSETKFEPAIPVSGDATQHLSSSPIFPHVYGPIDTIAIDGIGIIRKDQNGYHWPEEFVAFSKYIEDKVTA